jgi:hypothetical protein
LFSSGDPSCGPGVEGGFAAVKSMEMSEQQNLYNTHFRGPTPCCKPTKLTRIRRDEYRIIARLPNEARLSIPVGRLPTVSPGGAN